MSTLSRGARRLTERPGRVTIVVNGREVAAFFGETVGAVLAAMGQRALRREDRRGELRGLFCGMGVCQECRVTVDGVPNARACMTGVREGMRVELPGVEFGEAARE